jgi:hypothetical protein
LPVVPYKPAPTVGPSGQQTPFLRSPSGLDEAFGVGLGKAFQGLGGQIERASDVAARGALEFQNLQNESDAKNGDIDAMVQTGQVLSDFTQLEGDAALKALPEYQERLKQVRQKSLDSMPNPAARRMLDQIVSRRVGFALVDMGRHAGNQAKVANDQAATARVEAAKRDYDPSNPATAKVVEDTLEGEIRQKGKEKGMHGETIDNLVDKERSRMWLNGLRKLAPNDPTGAKEFYDDRKEQMDPDTREVGLQIVNRAIASKQTRTDAQEIIKRSGFDPAKGPGQEKKILDLADKYKEKYKDNPEYADYLDSRVKSLYATGMQGYRDTQNGYEHRVGSFILGQSDENRVVSIDGLIGPGAPKEIREAYEGMEPAKQKKVLGWIRQVSQGDKSLTPERLRKEMELKGMASDPETVEEFVNMGAEGIFKENLTLAQTRGLLATQQKLRQQPQFIDNFVNKGMRQIAPMLDAAKVTLKDDRSGYLQFRAAFEEAIRDKMGDKGILPPRKDLEGIASTLLQDQYKDKWYRFKSEVFRGADIPDHIQTDIKNAYRERGIADPTDEQLARAYSLILFKRAYGETGKAPKTDKQ